MVRAVAGDKVQGGRKVKGFRPSKALSPALSRDGQPSRYPAPNRLFDGGMPERSNGAVSKTYLSCLYLSRSVPFGPALPGFRAMRASPIPSCPILSLPVRWQLGWQFSLGGGLPHLRTLRGPTTTKEICCVSSIKSFEILCPAATKIEESAGARAVGTPVTLGRLFEVTPKIGDAARRSTVLRGRRLRRDSSRRHTVSGDCRQTCRRWAHT